MSFPHRLVLWCARARTHSCTTLLAFILTCAFAGCSSDGADKDPCEGVACGLDATAGPTSVRDAGMRDAFVKPATFVSDASPGEELQARVQVNGANVGCGACAVLIAQVQGGKTPYSYAWSDPALKGPGPHQVCPTAPTAYSVIVSDSSEIIGGEFAQPAQEVQAQGKVDCVADAGPGFTGCFTSSGATDAGVSDAGAAVTCAEPGDAGISFDLTTGVVGTVTISTEMPMPFKAGAGYEYSHDRLLPFTLSLGQTLTADIYGAKEHCKPTEKLFSLTYDLFTWHQSFCFTPKEDYAYLIVAVHLDGVLASWEFLTSGTTCAGCSMK